MQGWPAQIDAPDVHWAERYELWGSGAPLSAEEVEHGARLALELIVLWQGDVLSVRHWTSPGVVFAGDAASTCDVALPAEALGAERLCVAIAGRNEVQAVVPPGARAWLSLPAGQMRPLEPAPSSSEAASAERLVPLGLGHRAHLCFADLEIQVAAVAAGRAPGRRHLPRLEGTILLPFLLSALAVGAILSTLSALTPPLGLTPDERITEQRRYLLRTYLEAAAERETRPQPALDAARAAAARPALPPSRYQAPARAAERLEPGPRAAQRPAEPELHAERGEPSSSGSREAAIREAQSFGIIALLAEHIATLRDERLPFTRELGSEEVALMGQMFDAETSWDEGPGGLALSSTGRRGGGVAEVVPLKEVGTVASGDGTLPEAYAYAGRASGSHRPRAPLLNTPAGVVPAAIRSTLQAHAGRLRDCHAPEQRASAGKSVLRFVVQSGGRVEQLRVLGTGASRDVVQCIEGVLVALSLPSSSEPVSVTYPLPLVP